MSKSHSYRIQLHCDKKMHSDINQFAQERGLSQSGAAKLLIDRALVVQSDAINERLGELDRLLRAAIHASSASRIFASEAAQAANPQLVNDEIKGRIDSLYKRYCDFEGVNQI